MRDAIIVILCVAVILIGFNTIINHKIIRRNNSEILEDHAYILRNIKKNRDYIFYIFTHPNRPEKPDSSNMIDTNTNITFPTNDTIRCATYKDYDTSFVKLYPDTTEK